MKDNCKHTDYLISFFNTGCQEQIYIPNTFSPNHDGMNNVWKIESKGAQVLKMTIYNRSGAVIYSTAGNEQDGSFHGAVAPSGVYVYIIPYQNNGTVQFQYKYVSITLIR